MSFLTASIVTHKLFRVSEKSSVFRVLKFFKKIRKKVLTFGVHMDIIILVADSEATR